MVLITCMRVMASGRLAQGRARTAVAAGPPDTHDGNTYVGQTGTTASLACPRCCSEAPRTNLLAYALPGLWCGADQSAGIALTWTVRLQQDAKKIVNAGRYRATSVDASPLQESSAVVQRPSGQRMLAGSRSSSPTEPPSWSTKVHWRKWPSKCTRAARRFRQPADDPHSAGETVMPCTLPSHV